MMYTLQNEKCANCGACVNACPVAAIRVNSQDVFYNMVIDNDICIRCGKCVQVCPIQHNDFEMNVREAYWGYHKNKHILRKSSSGGAFAALTHVVLKKGGVVFGAAYEDDLSVMIRSSMDVPVEAFYKSKYVESLVGDSFQQAKCILNQGRIVLYSGTPCQIAGLRSFLGKEYSNLYTCDFTCGGMPSHKMYKEHLAELEYRYGEKAKKVDFRPKTYGWSTHAIQIDFENGRKYVSPAILDSYFSTFLLKNVNVRDYCYQCKFSKQHMSDVTLADFWKYRTLIRKRPPEKGVSLVLANTEKGSSLLDETKEEMDLFALSVEDAIYNIREKSYTEEHMKLRREFLSCYSQHGLKKASNVIGMHKKHEAVVIQVKSVMKGILSKLT